MVNVAKKLIGKTGTKLYSSICGACNLQSVNFDRIGYEIECKRGFETYWFDKYGRHSDCVKKIPSDAECVLFFSQDERDWTQVYKESDEMKSIDQRANEYASEDTRHEYLPVRQEAYCQGARDQLHIDLKRLHELWEYHKLMQAPVESSSEKNDFRECQNQLMEDPNNPFPAGPRGIHWNDGYYAHDKIGNDIVKKSIQKFLKKLVKEILDAMSDTYCLEHDSFLTNHDKINDFKWLPSCILSDTLKPSKYCTDKEIYDFVCFPIPSYIEWEKAAKRLQADGMDLNISSPCFYKLKMEEYLNGVIKRAKDYLNDKMKDSMHYANKDSIKAFLNKLDEESAESVYPDAPMDSILTDLSKIQQFEGLPMTIFTRIGSQCVPPIQYCKPEDILNFRCFPVPTFKEWKENAQCMVANGIADPNVVDAAIYIKKMRDYRTTIRLQAKDYLIDKTIME